jgi:predicted HicB family RNase H-like nuclease
MAVIHYEIPDELHRRAKAAAALQGKTLKDFLVEALNRAVADSHHDAERTEQPG